MEVKNIPSCFYYKNGIFIRPYKDNLIKITMRVEIGYNMGNYEINKDDDEYYKLVDFFNNHEEIKKLNLISIKTIWRGVRAMSYDNLPFFTKIDTNIFWMSGGSFNGTYLSKYYGEWFSEYILDKSFTNIPNNFDPTLNRLKKIKLNYYLILIIILIIIILIIITAN
jgi:glycine/D-amino acid oxidase-like deaminating enzyme